MWAVASSFNYLLFFDFVFKDWVTAFLHIILERFISKSISFAFRFSCHFRYASNFGSFPRFSSRASHFKKTLFTSAINPSVDYSLFLFSSFPRISSRVSFFIDVSPWSVITLVMSFSTCFLQERIAHPFKGNRKLDWALSLSATKKARRSNA